MWQSILWGVARTFLAAGAAAIGFGPVVDIVSTGAQTGDWVNAVIGLVGFAAANAGSVINKYNAAKSGNK